MFCFLLKLALHVLTVAELVSGRASNCNLHLTAKVRSRYVDRTVVAAEL